MVVEDKVKDRVNDDSAWFRLPRRIVERRWGVNEPRGVCGNKVRLPIRARALRRVVGPGTKGAMDVIAVGALGWLACISDPLCGEVQGPCTRASLCAREHGLEASDAKDSKLLDVWPLHIGRCCDRNGGVVRCIWALGSVLGDCHDILARDAVPEGGASG